MKNNPDGSQTLLGHVPNEVKNSKATFHHHAPLTQSIDLSIILPYNNQSDLNKLLKCQYDPTCPGYHQWLTPAQFAQKFATSSPDLESVKNYFKAAGFHIASISQNGTILKVTGTVGEVTQVFGSTINYYQNADYTLFFGPDTDPNIPAPLAGKILAIGGLDNLSKYHAHYHPIEEATPNVVGSTGPISASAIKPAYGTGPGGYLAPNDVKTAYNLNSVPSTGAGQTFALFELDGYTASDITAYDAQFGLPGVPLQNVYVDGFNGTPNYSEGAPEVTLDIELITAFAPGSSKILVYEAPNSFQSWQDEWTKIATDNTAKIISCSWGIAELDSPTVTFDNAVFQQMAAQGQAVFASSGDSGAYDDGSTISVDEPAAQPYVTGVGISALSTNANWSYKSESASLYGGGGISVNQLIPNYQLTVATQAVAAALVSTKNRNVPDLALTADYTTPYSFYINGSWAGYWGSSLATPIWASFIALVNQGLGANGPLGFPNPTLYGIAQSSSYTNDFHDITSGNNQYYPAGPGFDDATGLGSFNGLNLYNDLVNQGSTIPVAPTGLNASVGNAQVVLSWNSSIGATSYNLKRATVSGGPYTTIAPSLTNTTYVDSPLTNGIAYYYVVSAVNSKGESLNSTQASATPSALFPTTPTALQATGGNDLVNLSWTASPQATSYNLKRSTTSGGPYTTVASSLANTAYTDSPLTNGTTYFYVVSAVNATGESPNSAQVSVTPMAPLLLPTVPTNVSIGTETTNSIEVSWSSSTPGTDGLAGYKVFRNNTLVSTTTFTEYFDTGLTPATSYSYSIASYDYAGNVSAQSAPVIGTTVPSNTPPTAPTGLTVSAPGGGTYIGMYWNVSPLAASYNIKRAIINGGPYTTIGTSSNTTFADITGTAGATYYYVVSGVNATGQEGPNSVQASVTLAPAAPVLTATAGNAQVTLSWTGTPGATYSVCRSTISIGSCPTIANGLTVTTYTDNTVTNGTTYYYIVSAFNASGSEASNQVSATPLPSIPPAPIFINVAGSNNQVNLNWYASTGATSYNLKRSTTSGGPYTIVAGSINATNYTDSAVTNGTTYYYVISALNLAGESPNSNPYSATPLAPPLAPTGLSTNAGNSRVTISWNVSAGAVAYIVQRATVSGGPYIIIGSADPATFYSDSTVSNGVTYFYVVQTINADHETSNNSTEVSATPMAPPAAPTGLNAFTGNNQVVLSWNASTGAAQYVVYRSTVNVGPYTSIATPVSTNYIDSSVTDGTTYYYVVAAVNNGGQSANSNQVSATPIDNVPPSVPTNLAGTAISPNQINLTWTASTDNVGVVGYKVYRNGTLIGTPGMTTYLDTGLISNTSYIYTVSAFDAVGNNSAQSTSINVMTLTAPPLAPSNVSATPGVRMVSITWSASVGATSYNVERSLTSGGPYSTVFPVTGGSTISYADTTVTVNTTYYYVVVAVNASGNSPASMQASATPITPTSPPPTLTAVPGNNEVSLTWAIRAGAASYLVERSTTSGGPYKTTFPVAGTNTSTYTDTSVTNGTTYYYVVLGVDSGGNSGPSPQASATPIPISGPPVAPSNLSATVTLKTVTLTWSPSNGATSYIVERSTINGGPYSTTFPVAGGATTSYTDTTVVNPTTYYYVVVAVNAAGNSPASAQISAMPTTPTSPPPTLTAVAGNGKVSLTWAIRGGATSYLVERSTTSGGPYTTTFPVAGTNTSTYTDTSVTNGTTYYYVVLGVDAAGNSGPSPQASATPVA